MDFSIEAIRNAHMLYTGPDFPKLIKEFIHMGMVTNIVNIETGVVTYIDNNGVVLNDTGVNVGFQINESATYENALAALQRNQNGESDFSTFCNEIAIAGVYKWEIDLTNMTCSYFDKTETSIIVENIPHA